MSDKQKTKSNISKDNSNKQKTKSNISKDNSNKQKMSNPYKIKQKNNHEVSNFSIAFGMLFTLLAFIIIFFNELDSINQYKILDQGAGEVISIDADIVNPSNDGKLVHLTGIAESEKMINDNLLKLSVEAIKLRRIVEMYQWNEKKINDNKKESKNKLSNDYEKKWSKNLINSKDFNITNGHENPKSMILDNREFIAKDVKIGEFRLSNYLVNKIRGYQKLPYNDSSIIFLK